MKERNEDEFGIIQDQNQQFTSLESAQNYVDSLKGKLERKAKMEDFPVTTAMPEDRMKFINYSISLMTKQNLPFTDNNKIIKAKSVLYLLAQGYTYQSIAHWLKKNISCNATVEQIKAVEQEGIKMAQDCISKVQNTKIPIVGGV